MTLESIWKKSKPTKKYGLSLPSFMKEAKQEGYTQEETKKFIHKKFK